MPITLERYTDMLSFARDIFDKTLALTSHATRVRQRANLADTKEELYKMILELCAGIEAIRLHDPDIMRKFLEEEAHFKFRATKNSRAAHYMRRYRARLKAREEGENDDAYLGAAFEARQRIEPTTKLKPEPKPEPKLEAEPEVEVQSLCAERSAERNPMLDQIDSTFILTRLSLIQEHSGEEPTSSDIANLYRKCGANEDEVAERTQFWIDQLISTGVIEPTAFPYQYRVL